MTALVVGVGNADRGDDAVGARVAAAVAGRRLPGVAVLTLGDPLGLLDVWVGEDLVVVVDALRSGAPAGTVLVLEPDLRGGEAEPLGAGGAGSTHGLGVASAVGLGRALGRLPRRLVVVGVEGGCYEHGAAPSPPVARAVGPAADLVTDLVSGPGAAAGPGGVATRGEASRVPG